MLNAQLAGNASARRLAGICFHRRLNGFGPLAEILMSEPLLPSATRSSSRWGGVVFSVLRTMVSPGVKAMPGLTDHEIRTLYVSGSTLFAGSIHGGAFRSTDYGEHWAPVNVGITDTTVLAFARDLHGPSLYAGTANKGVFVSTNDGDTWRPIDGVLSNTRIGSLFADGGLLLAGCGDAEWYSQENGGVFRSIGLRGKLGTIRCDLSNSGCWRNIN